MLAAVRIFIDPTSIENARTMFGDPTSFYCGTLRFVYDGSYGPVHWINGLDTIHFVDGANMGFGTPFPTSFRMAPFPGIRWNFKTYYGSIDPSPGILSGLQAIIPSLAKPWR